MKLITLLTVEKVGKIIATQVLLGLQVKYRTIFICP
jgi:hypothetical protein